MNYGTHDYDHDPKPVFLGTACMTNWASPLCFAIKQTALLALGLASGHQKLCGASKYGERLAIEPAAPRADGGRIRGAYYRRLGVDAGARVVGPAARAGGGEGAGGAEHRGARDRSHTGCRLHYLEKLSYQKVWLPHGLRPPRTHTVIIFDWDDTLFCTSYLYRVMKHHGFDEDAAEGLPELRMVGAASRRLLELARQLGQTYIITNAVEGWVQSTAFAFMPDLVPTLRHVRVISARSAYEARCRPGAAGEWKARAFVKVRRELDLEPVTNLVSIGDSQHEVDAAHLVGREFANVSVKTIKLRAAPTPMELCADLLLIERGLSAVVAHGGACLQWGPLECSQLSEVKKIQQL
mmetsp:Transcript_83955/g.238105  ORF Transcript_83955/g.238105 Transcript_83955/m.238105 type:complete len:352 (-) Transcript_83955:97-1152(-)